MKFKEFKEKLSQAQRESDIGALYARLFTIDSDSTDNHDLYTPQILFEFKADKNFENVKALSKILAQALYYVRELKVGDSKKTIPSKHCLADKNEACITEVSTWSNYFSSDAYDWSRAPSQPDPILVDHLEKEPLTRELRIWKVQKKTDFTTFKKVVEAALDPQLELEFGSKKEINEENFEAVYVHWNDIIGRMINDDVKKSLYFLSNLRKEDVILDQENNRIAFQLKDGSSKTHKILMRDYRYFWDQYEHVQSADILSGIKSKLDRLTDESQRRFEGEFFTPLRFAKKGLKYLEDTLGPNWHETGKYRVWDMAAGTGNLEYHLPAQAYKYCYLSTLHASEADHLQRVFPEATCFQYDYLNDDVDFLSTKGMLPFEPQWKLPKALRDDLSDPSLHWIVYINPPFATAQNAKQKDSKVGVSKTKIEALMSEAGLGAVKRELFAQFMYRIKLEIPANSHLGMFSTLKYLNAPDSISYRDEHFDFKFEKGFVFHSKNFQGIDGDFPIAFLLWDLSSNGVKEVIDIDILDNEAKAVGVKHLRLIQKNDVINKWFERPKNSDAYILPPLGGALTVKDKNSDKRHRARPDFLASIVSKGNDFQNCKYVAILSSPSASAGAFTVNKDNFLKAVTLHAVRKIPTPTWLNDRNQFLKPKHEPALEFYTDCVVWSLFSNSNGTASLKDVDYNEKIYQIKNHFFPFTIAELNQWSVRDEDMRFQMVNDTDRFVAKWLSTVDVSSEGREVLDKARHVYTVFFDNLHNMLTHTWKIENWDSGWYQIRQCLKEHNLAMTELGDLHHANQNLADKILPQIMEYGFLEADEVFDKPS